MANRILVGLALALVLACNGAQWESTGKDSAGTTGEDVDCDYGVFFFDCRGWCDSVMDACLDECDPVYGDACYDNCASLHGDCRPGCELLACLVSSRVCVDVEGSEPVTCAEVCASRGLMCNHVTSVRTFDSGTQCAPGSQFGEAYWWTCYDPVPAVGGIDCACTSSPDTCGNGILDEFEKCDGDQFGGHSCASLGYEGGELNCDSDTCTLDPSGCTPNCGNGVIEAGEQCDGEELGGHTCALWGYSSGELKCTPMCVFDASDCGFDGSDCVSQARVDSSRLSSEAETLAFPVSIEKW